MAGAVRIESRYITSGPCDRRLSGVGKGVLPDLPSQIGTRSPARGWRVDAPARAAASRYEPTGRGTPLARPRIRLRATDRARPCLASSVRGQRRGPRGARPSPTGQRGRSRHGSIRSAAGIAPPAKAGPSERMQPEPGSDRRPVAEPPRRRGRRRACGEAGAPALSTGPSYYSWYCLRPRSVHGSEEQDRRGSDSFQWLARESVNNALVLLRGHHRGSCGSAPCGRRAGTAHRAALERRPARG